MGRIAQALQKAQRERDEQLRLGLGPDADGVGSAVLADAPPAAPAGDSTAVRGIEPETAPSRRPTRLDGNLPGWSHRRTSAPMDPMPTWDVDPTVVAVHDRSSSITEQYRAVRTWLLSHTTVGEHNCVAITSAVAREGKTVTSANLAVIMAEVRHQNVLVVDSDLRCGALAKLFRRESAPGLAEVLGGTAPLADAIQRTPIPNLSFLPSGKPGKLNPTELFSSKAAGLVFDEICERYHYVLVDTPPVQTFSDVGVIGRFCSGIIVVVRMHKTTSNVVRQSVQWLQSNNLNVLGCIAAANDQSPAQLVYQYAGVKK